MAFQFPPSPTVNQTFTPVAGTTYRWSGTAWHLLAGPGAFITQAEGDARYASLTNPIFTVPVRHADGTAAAPGISFANEPATGLYRAGAGTISFSGNGTSLMNVGPTVVSLGVIFKATNAGAYVYPAPVNEFHSGTAGNYVLGVANGSGNPYGVEVRYSNVAPRGTANSFLICADLTGILAELKSNGGLHNYSANNVNISDERAKLDIGESPDHTGFVSQLTFKRFRYADQPNMGEVDDVTAQDIERYAPELVTPFGEDGTKGVLWYQVQQRINSVLPRLIERIKVLEEKLAALEKS